MNDISHSSAGAFLIGKAERPGVDPQYAIAQAQTTVGRHPSNTICIPLDSISRFHARIDIRGSHFILTDLNSSNGTFVNGEKVASATLHDGDLVVFGNVDFEFVHEGSTSKARRLEPPRIVASQVDILDVPAAGTPPLRTHVIRVDQAPNTSNYVSSSGSTDHQTLVKINNRLATLYALSELLRERSGESEKEILQSVLDLVFEAVPADRGAILTRLSRDAQEFDVAVVKHRERPLVEQKLSLSRTILDRVVNEKVAVLSSDAQADARFEAAESVILQNVHSTMCVPMISQGRVLGVVYLDTQTLHKQFLEDDLEFITTLATEVAVALENSRMRYERLQREQLAVVGETVAGISHNVKNILLLSQGGSEVLDRAVEAGNIEQIRESWGVVRRGIDKIGKLVKDMLDYSRPRKPSISDTDINAMICQIAEEIEDEMLRKNIRLELEIEDEIEPFRTDEALLCRVLTNLLVNAAEAISHDEGLITVLTERMRDGALMLRVRDNGCGIPPDKLDKVFFPFYSSKGSAGTGLGLSMCKKMIEDLDGTLTVESVLGEGTAFTVIVPPWSAGDTVGDTHS